jgi:transcriptional antiterminator RfaH
MPPTNELPRNPAGHEHGNSALTVAWFCLQTQPRHEKIAANFLRQFEDVEVFNPRLQFTRSTRVGPALVCESMFPNYLFARFNWMTGLSKVRYGNGVSRVVHFGDRWPTIPREIIEELRLLVGPEEVHAIPDALAPGDTVSICGGHFHGLEAVITQVMPGRDRVRVLMNFLGDMRYVELEAGALVKAAR